MVTGCYPAVVGYSQRAPYRLLISVRTPTSENPISCCIHGLHVMGYGSRSRRGLGFFGVFFMVFWGIFLWFSGLRLQKTCKNHKDRPNLGFFWGIFFMVFWASMYGTCTRRKDGPYVFIYVKHTLAVGDNLSPYILKHAPSFGDNGSSYILNTPPHSAIPLRQISLTRARIRR